MNNVLVRGDGVAAYCCAHLLRQAGIPVALDHTDRPRLPAIMLSESALSFIADTFGHKDLFRDLPRIRTRVVQWGSAPDPITLPHSAVVVSEQMLLDNLRPSAAVAESADKPGWRVLASGRPPASAEQRFGSRTATALTVDLKNDDISGCWVESTEEGWLFLVGTKGKGWLLSAGAEAGMNLERSRLVAKHIDRLGEPLGRFPASPRIAVPLCRAGGERWLACGTAALAFDPLCGDGAAHAVREAILATAAIRAVFAGAPADEVLAHYEARLTAGFERHLAYCSGFYHTGGQGPWWNAELQALERGIAWCRDRLSEFPEFRYRLNGYQLEAIA
jgi:hypothetical protein